jgi:DNA-binding transcriptional LysR family regulator
MELRHLRYFVAVAEELSFTRAAERLHIGQPPLSQQIQALEEEVGARLLDRSRRWVRLTAAGRLFLDDARRILALTSDAAQTARRAERGELGELRIGFNRSIPLTDIFAKTVNMYRKQFPHVTLSFTEMSTMRQIEAIHERRLDLGFIRPPETDIPGVVRLTTLQDYRLSVVTNANHRLARKSSVAIEDLADETFVTFPRDEGTTIYPQIVRLCREAGFEPKIGMEAREASTLMGLVAAGCGISILPELFNCIQITDVVFRPLRGPKATTKLMIANRGDEHFPLVDAFLGTAVDIARVGR